MLFIILPKQIIDLLNTHKHPSLVSARYIQINGRPIFWWNFYILTFYNYVNDNIFLFQAHFMQDREDEAMKSVLHNMESSSVLLPGAENQSMHDSSNINILTFPTALFCSRIVMINKDKLHICPLVRFFL